MPNYDKRYQTADEIRRDVDYARRNYPMTPKNVAILNEHMKYADMLENQNEREEMRRGVAGTGRRYYPRSEMEYGNAEMKEYKENPKRYSAEDYPRQEYDEMEMRRRRDSKGRYMDYDNREYNRVYPPNEILDGTEMRGRSDYYPAPYPIHTPPYMAHDEQEKRHKQSIGFAANQNKKRKEYKTGQMDDKQEFDEMVDELKEYLEDYAKHSKLAKESNDPTEQKHASMELAEAMEYMNELMAKVAKMAHSPQEKQEMQKAMQKMQQEVQKAQQQSR